MHIHDVGQEPVGNGRDNQALSDLIDNYRADDGRAERSALAWESRINRESMRFGGLLVALTETQIAVTLQLVDGSNLHGVLRSVGTDVAEVQRQSGVTLLVSIGCIDSLRTGSARLIASDRQPSGTTLRDLLHEFSEHRARLRIQSRSGGDESGTIDACGEDVCALRTDQRSYAYVPIASIMTVTELRS